MGNFSDKVFDVVKRIPEGKVSTYGQVARLIGAPRSARYVGYALRANPSPGIDASSIPCHRVVFKDGSLATGFAFGGEDIQRKMLIDEGVVFVDEHHVDMDKCQWSGSPARSRSGVSKSDDATDVDERSMCEKLDDAFPTAPPPDFDWERELGED